MNRKSMDVVFEVVLDGKTGISQGFSLVYYEAAEDAKAAKEAMKDQKIDGRRIRVDFFRRHVRSRDAPDMSNCLSVFGLGLYTTESELEKEFSKFGALENVQVVLDGKTSSSRGFSFVFYKAAKDAKAAKEAMDDQEIDGRRIRVDFSITKRPHTPTPGVYMGRPTYSRGGSSSGCGERSACQREHRSASRSP